MNIKQLVPSIVIVVMVSAPVLAASDQGNLLEETMHSSGKIYVVVAVVTVLLLAVFGYLIALDRRLKRLENKKTDKR